MQIFLKQNMKIYFLCLISTTIIFCQSYGKENVVEGNLHNPKTNIEILTIISEKISNNISTYVDAGDTLCVNFVKTTDSWIVENTIVNSLIRNKDAVIFENKSCENNNNFEFAISKMFVQYIPLQKEGLFKKNRVTRIVNLEMFFKILKEKEIIVSDVINESYNDTIYVESINSLENKNFKSSMGELPKDSFINRIISPVIITSATAVIIYLFFIIRK